MRKKPMKKKKKKKPSKEEEMKKKKRKEEWTMRVKKAAWILPVQLNLKSLVKSRPESNTEHVSSKKFYL